MARTVGIGIQDFAKLRERNCFYVDKTSFIKEWCEDGSGVQEQITMILRKLCCGEISGR